MSKRQDNDSYDAEMLRTRRSSRSTRRLSRACVLVMIGFALNSLLGHLLDAHFAAASQQLFIKLVATERGRSHSSASAAPAERALSPDEARVVAHWQDDLFAGRFAVSDSSNLTLSLCAVASAEEARWISEWVLTHALLGVQHFYIYDTSHTSELAMALQFWLDLGLVTLIHPTYAEQDIAWGQAQTQALRSCMAHYGTRTEWLATWDLDEFLNFNGNPELSTLPERTGNGDWTYVAHRFLRQPRISAAAAIMVTQSNFCNWAADDPLSLLISQQTLRQPHDPSGNVARKLIAHSAWRNDHVSFTRAGHAATMGPRSPPDGIQPVHANVHGDWRQAPDGTSDGFNDWPYDHLVLNHYPARDQVDCLAKINVKLAANEANGARRQSETNNWRLAEGAEVFCDRRYVPRDHDFGSPRSVQPYYKHCSGPLVIDKILAQSFAARAVQDILPTLRSRAPPLSGSLPLVVSI